MIDGNRSRQQHRYQVFSVISILSVSVPILNFPACTAAAFRAI
jgi:hypothetical protein